MVDPGRLRQSPWLIRNYLPSGQPVFTLSSRHQRWRGRDCDMADQHGTIDNPITGERITFRRRARDTAGQLLEFELTLKPHSMAVPAHVHARQEEQVQVLSGSVRLRRGETEQVLTPGDTTSLAAGVPHSLWNDGESEAHMLVHVRPPLQTETAIETLFGLARDGRTNSKGMPNPLQGALLASEYGTFYPWPPIPVQRVLVTAVAPIARLLGYRSRYPQYSESLDD